MGGKGYFILKFVESDLIIKKKTSWLNVFEFVNGLLLYARL